MDQNFASSIAQGAKDIGQNAINSFNPTATQKNYLADYNSLTAGQFGQAQDYTKRFADTIAQNPSATQYQQQGNELYNVQPLAERANYLNTQVTNAYPNAVNQARGFDYSQGQVDNAVNQNLRFLSPQATAATGQAQVAQGLADTFANRGLQQTDINLRPITAEQSFIQQQQNNQSQAYIQANQAELQGLTAKMQSGIQLSQAEYSRYNQLVQAQAQIQQAQIQAENALKVQQLQNQGTLANTIQGQKYQTVAPSNNLVNTFAQGILNPATGQTRSY